jgi:hypothetical protein
MTVCTLELARVIVCVLEFVRFQPCALELVDNQPCAFKHAKMIACIEFVLFSVSICYIVVIKILLAIRPITIL